ncbi:hypothetical protein QJQ45_015532 [Haematococcus lacustris]|nr:hypothetical protein QJQ45_015532 [Haematococcus lacustris]
MPPKKKDKKESDKKPDIDDGSERELVEKELVIGYLKSKLGRYQDHGDQLQIENFKLSDDLETQKTNLRDINEFLTNELKARSLTTSALEAKNFELTQQIEDIRKSHEAAIGKLRAERDKEADNLRSIIADYEKKAKLMSDFLERKEALEAELASTQAELNAKVKEYEYRLTDLDRSHIQDREKWKRETLARIKETKIQMMKLTDNQLEMTTKRTIMENEQMSIELGYQSRQTEKLMSINTVLMEENSELRRQIALSKQTEQELARRNNAYQKTIKSLVGLGQGSKTMVGLRRSTFQPDKAALTKMKEQGSEQQQHGELVRGLEEHAAELELQVHLAQLQVDEANTRIDQLTHKLAERNRATEGSASQFADTAQFLAQATILPSASSLTRPGPPSASASVPSSSPGYEGGVEGWGGSGGVGVGQQGASRASGVAAAQQQEAAEGSRASAVVMLGRLEELSLEQRERVLSYLLERLHVHMHTAAGNQPGGPGSLGSRGGMGLDLGPLAPGQTLPGSSQGSRGMSRLVPSGGEAAGKATLTLGAELIKLRCFPAVVCCTAGCPSPVLQLPPIPAYPRRSPSSTTPISHGLLSAPGHLQSPQAHPPPVASPHGGPVWTSPTASGMLGYGHTTGSVTATGHTNSEQPGVGPGAAGVGLALPAASWPSPSASQPAGSDNPVLAGAQSQTGPKLLLHQQQQGELAAVASPKGAALSPLALPPVDDLLSQVRGNNRKRDKRPHALLPCSCRSCPMCGRGGKSHPMCLALAPATTKAYSSSGPGVLQGAVAAAHAANDNVPICHDMHTDIC